MNIILLVIGLSALGVVGDYFIKIAGVKSFEPKWLAVGTLIYALTAIGWFFAMKQMKLSTLGALYSITIILLLTIVGVGYFKESLGLREIAGIIAAVISVILLAKFV